MARRRNNQPAPPTLQEQSSMGYDIARAQASQDPRAYSNRWEVSADGTVMPRGTNDGRQVAPNLHVTPGENGQMHVEIPQLAMGTAGYQMAQGNIQWPMMNMAAPPESNVWGDSEYFGMWDTVLDQRDGKWDIRRAIRWWHRDPLVYKCTKLLSQLANSRVVFKCQDDEVKELVENWFKQAMPYSFRSAFFLEYFRSGYVPVLKTLIPYQPRNYKNGKIPQVGKGGHITDVSHNLPPRAMNSAVYDHVDDEPAAPAVAEEPKPIDATQALLDRNQTLAAEYKLALAEYETLKANFEQRLCSAARLDKARTKMAEKQFRWLKGMVPGGYTILDPLLVDLKGPQSMQWLREPYLQISGDVISAVMSPTPFQKLILDQLPVEITQQIRDGATYVSLSSNICTIVTHDKQPYERYPTPVAKHCFDALEMKYDIMAMDKATVRGVKNRVLLVKIGNDTYPVTDPNAIQSVASVFNSVGRTGTFFWSHAIEMEWIEPDLSSFNDAEKYRHVNDEIRTTYGVAPILTGTAESGGAIGNHVMNFKGVKEEVTAAQNDFLEMLQKELRLLKAALSLSADVEVDFDRLNLQDEIQFWQVVCTAVMNGIIDHQTALETLGFHFPEMTKRMEDMQPLKEKGLFVPQPSANNLGPDGQMKPQGGAGGKGNGPTKKPGKNKNKVGKSQPKKAKASMRAVGDEAFVLCEADDFDQEQRREVAALYGTDTGHVLTVAEFTERFPQVDLTPPWPELSSLETVGATMAAASIMTKAEAKFEQLCTAFKAENGAAGARGAYLTSQKKGEFRTLANIETQFGHLKAIANTDTLPKGWERHFADTRAALAAQLGDVPTDQLDAHAFAMCSLRFKKSMI